MDLVFDRTLCSVIGRRIRLDARDQTFHAGMLFTVDEGRDEPTIAHQNGRQAGIIIYSLLLIHFSSASRSRPISATKPGSTARII
jgi:hypothetical protein